VKSIGVTFNKADGWRECVSLRDVSKWRLLGRMECRSGAWWFTSHSKWFTYPEAWACPLRYTYTYLWWHTCWYGGKVQLLQNDRTCLLVSSSVTLNVLAGHWQRSITERPGFNIR
jgi:hypothetical protein